MYTMTVRSKAKVRKERFEELDVALDAIERVGRELSDGAGTRPPGAR